MAEASEDGLLVLTAKGEVAALNGAVERLTGLRREALIGHRASHLGTESSFPWSVTGDAAKQRQPVSVGYTAESGAKLFVTAKPRYDRRDVLHYIVLTVRDITELSRVLGIARDGHDRAERRRRELRTAEVRERHASTIVGSGSTMRRARDLALRYAAVDSPVLLLGETGTGKRVFSQLIHQASSRGRGPFLELNCGAIPEGMIEAELFGYVRGAFTGADIRGKPGLVELAEGGTLLLDEVGDIPLGIQVKLLRFIEEGEIWPIGGLRAKRVDVRILAATNQDLPALTARGAFRRDLFYRLDVLTLSLPPVRERREDIPALVAMMLERLTSRSGRQVIFTPAALSMIAELELPGNIRELWNLVERLVVTSDADVIDVGDLPADVVRPVASSRTDATPHLRRALEDVEAQILREALARYGSQTMAATHLGVSQSTVARRVKRYGLPQRD